MPIEEGKLQELLDKQAISEQLITYGRATDRLDAALGKSVFHPDAIADYGPEMFQGSGWGFIDWLTATASGVVSSSHQYCNITIRISGETAYSEAYSDVIALIPTEGSKQVCMRSLGRHLDVWEKREGTWRIAKRRYVHDLEYKIDAPETPFSITGRRNPSDPSYALGLAPVRI